MDIVEEVRKFVESESQKPTSKYGYEPYQFHFIPMVKYAQELADELGADKEIVTLAGWMHDIGAVMEGREKHHIYGANIAEQKLRELNYPEDRIEKVKNCIFNHRGSVDNARETLEEKIVAEADAMSNFENIGGLFKAAYEFENLDQEEARKSVKAKLQRKYNKLHFEKSKEIIKPKYDAAMLLLN